ncbi:hypothetical protein O181_071103 [Austropuccinia psidii MF-1]|uniref:HAT C-terminal dimerisation domain-containing protein n=1 Tax=Austropuccinia psidii MF-1 TaxID=1389203 RepID=A0A9Q3F514_9BASI|nr:hypothetical protein [Austropuccinia psidii MF-1]
MSNNDSLIACLSNPKCKDIFKQLCVPIHQSKEVIEVLNNEMGSLISQKNFEDQANLRTSSPQDMSKSEHSDLLCHLNKPPIEASYKVPNSQGDELVCSLQNLHPMTKGEPINSYYTYWKRQIVTGNFPTLGQIALRCLTIAAGSAYVERVFSHSGRLRTPTRAALGARTIAHLTCLKEWLNDETTPSQ